MNNEKRFIVSGSISVSGIPEEDASGAILGYRLPDGRLVRLAMALEVESEDGSNYTYLSNDKDMQSIGFDIVRYDQTQFE